MLWNISTMIKTDGNMFIRRLFFLLWQNLSSFWNVLLKLCCTFNYGKFRLLISTSRKTQVRWRFLVGCSYPEWWYIRHFFFFCKYHFHNWLCLYTCWCLNACSTCGVFTQPSAAFLQNDRSIVINEDGMLTAAPDPQGIQYLWWSNDLYRQERWPWTHRNQIKAVTIKWQIVNI